MSARAFVAPRWASLPALRPRQAGRIAWFLAAAAALAAAAPVGAQCLQPPSGLVAHWTLDEAAGAASIRDWAGAGNHGTPRPGGTLGPPGGPAAGAGKVRGAVLFDSNGSSVGPHVEIADHPELDFGSGDFTIETWVRGPHPGSIYLLPMLDKLDGSIGYNLTLITNLPGAAQMRFQMGDGTTSNAFHSGGAQPIPLDNATWTHIAVVVARSSSSIRQYVNGVLAATHATSFAASIDNALPVLIGEARLVGLNQEALTIDELSLYARALDGSEVQAIAASGAAGKCRTFRIAASAGANGSIAPSGDVPVVEGGSQGFAITPDPGYRIDDVLVDGASIGPASSHTFTAASADHTIAASFEPRPVCVAPPPGMSAWWPFDETSGTHAAEIMGGAHGVLQPGVVHAAGRVAGGVRITGAAQYVVAADRPDLNFGTASFSIDAWVRTLDAATAVRTIVDKRDGSRGYSLFISFGRLGLQLADGTGFTNYVPTPLGPLTDGQWHHVAATVDRSSPTGGRLYVDGALYHTFDPTGRAGSITSAAPLLIGQAFDGSLDFNGDIDEVELFGRALSAAEVAAIVQAEEAGKCKPAPTACIPPPSGLVGWWPLDESGGGSALDLAAGWPGSYGSASHAAGQVGNAARVTSSAGFLTIPDAPHLDLGTGDFSIDAWVRTLDAATSVRTILDKRDGSRGYALFISFGRLGLQLADGTGFTNYVPTPNGPLTNGQWHHVAVCVDRSSTTGGRLYVDGALTHTFDPTGRAGDLSNAREIRLGQAYNGSSINFNGLIDEVEIFGRALDAAEVAALWQAGGAGKCKPVPASVAGGPAGAIAFTVGNNPLRRGSFELRFELSRGERARLEVFDVGGRLQRVLADRAFLAGRHALVWDGAGADGRPLARGVYFARLSLAAGGTATTRRLVLLR